MINEIELLKKFDTLSSEDKKVVFKCLNRIGLEALEFYAQLMMLVDFNNTVSSDILRSKISTIAITSKKHLKDAMDTLNDITN